MKDTIDSEDWSDFDYEDWNSNDLEDWETIDLDDWKLPKLNWDIKELKLFNVKKM
jgi:hypothetical protein